MTASDRFKPLRVVFGYVAAIWIALWVLSYLVLGGLFGSSWLILGLYAAMAFCPPALLYLAVFRAVPALLRLVRTQRR
jgi:hypothetical protein